MKAAGAIIGVVLALLALTWVVQGNDFFMLKVFAPKYEQVRRETFEQSKAYRQGMVQELQNMQFEWVKADDAHKAALADIILRRAADFPDDDMTPDLRAFVSKLRFDRNNGGAK